MARAVTDRVRETLSAVLRETLEGAGDAEPKKRRGRGALSRVTRLAAGAALAAAAAPVAKRGADALRANREGPIARIDVTPAALLETAAQGMNDVQRTVRGWTEMQKLKRGATDPGASAEAGVGSVADERSSLVQDDDAGEVG